MKDATEDELKKAILNVKKELAKLNDTENRPYKLSLSMGYSLYDHKNDDMDSFFRHMDEMMYEEKEQMHSARE